MSDLSPSELSQRVALLKRFKELLSTQRDRFKTYLDALDKQQKIISDGNADDLIRHVELEEKIVEDIFSIQKVIEPLDQMYNSMVKDSGVDEVINLKDSLGKLKTEAAQLSAQNRVLLAKRMGELRSEIAILKNNPYKRRSGFSNSITPSKVDIKG